MKDNEIFLLTLFYCLKQKQKKAVEVMKNLAKASGFKPLAGSKKPRVLTALYERNEKTEKVLEIYHSLK